MADNVLITPGSGATIASDDVSGVQFQKVKLDGGGDGLSVPLVIDVTYGVPSDVKRVAGNVTVVQATATNLKVDASGVAVPITDNSGSLTVDAPVGTPVFVRLSDGSAAITTLPVSGSVTGAQGTAAANAGAWPTKISDGTDSVGISTVSAVKALKVDVVQSVGAVDQADLTTIGNIKGVGGLYNDSPSDPSSGQVAAIRTTQKRGLHVNLRAAAGTEIGSSGAPLRTDPTGTTKQPANLFDATGTAFSQTNPLPVTDVYTPAGTAFTEQLTYAASQTITAFHSPTSGKTLYLERVIIIGLTAGYVTLVDGPTDGVTARIFKGSVGVGMVIIISYKRPRPLAAGTNGILKYITGSGATGDITVEGFEI